MPNDFHSIHVEKKYIDKKLMKGDFKDIFGSCNSEVNGINSNILLFQKDDICDILSKSEAKKPTFDYDNVPENSCLNIQREEAVIGFFLSPTSSAGWSQVVMNLIPVYAGQNGHKYIEATSGLFPMNPNAIGISHHLFYPYVFRVPISTTHINHNIFQFHPDAVNLEFMKSFISWYELKCILDNCDYLGISGSLVMTGNIGTNDTLNNQYITGHENKAYFTYRVIGFKIRSNPFNELPKELKNVDKSSVLIKSNQEIKRNNIEYDFRIPTETWASPCPPMWRPN